MDKFQNRYYMIKEIYEEYLDTDEYIKGENESDPFWDPKERKVIAQCYVSLMPLAYLMTNEVRVPLIGEEG